MLQTVANIEANRLGLPNELNVGGSNLSDGTLGSYDDRMHAIHINLELLETGSPDEALRSCCHEVYHSYQYRLVEAREAAGEELAGLRLFRSAAESRRSSPTMKAAAAARNFTHTMPSTARKTPALTRKKPYSDTIRCWRKCWHPVRMSNAPFPRQTLRISEPRTSGIKNPKLRKNRVVSYRQNETEEFWKTPAMKEE